MKLIAERLYLRDFVPADTPAVHEYASSLEVVRHQEWGPNTLEQTMEFVAASIEQSAVADGTFLQLAAVLNDGTLIGAYRATFSEDRLEAEIGYSLGPRFSGQGFATEAALTLIGYLKSDTPVRTVFATCRPENAASIRVLEKLGMKQVDCYKRNVLIRGEWRDTLVFSVEVQR